jgi:hypothetical protein
LRQCYEQPGHNKAEGDPPRSRADAGLPLMASSFHLVGRAGRADVSFVFTPLRTDCTGSPTGLQHVLDYAIGGMHLKAHRFEYN